MMDRRGAPSGAVEAGVEAAVAGVEAAGVDAAGVDAAVPVEVPGVVAAGVDAADDEAALTRGVTAGEVPVAAADGAAAGLTTDWERVSRSPRASHASKASMPTVRWWVDCFS